MEIYEIKAEVFRWASILLVFCTKNEQTKDSLFHKKLHSFSSFNSPVKWFQACIFSMISKLGNNLKLQRHLTVLTHSRYWQQFAAWQCGASWTRYDLPH